MILKQSELSLLRRGKRSFTLSTDPDWKPGQVVRLRASRQDEGFVITVTEVVESDGGFKIRFTPGDSRDEEIFIAAGWPDYTSDPFRAMRDEMPPMPETAEERKIRVSWFKLGGGHDKSPKAAQPADNVDSRTRPEIVRYAAGSEDAVRVIRRWVI